MLKRREASISTQMRTVALRAKEASRRLPFLPASVKDAALRRIASALYKHREDILAQNALDVADARLALERGELSRPLVDRVTLDSAKLELMIASIQAVARLDDPVGCVMEHRWLQDKLELRRVSVPLGVILAVFEARQDAVTQIGSLALKSGNAVLLKCGRESTRTTNAIVQCMREAVASTGEIASDVLCAVPDREAADALFLFDDIIDLVVPRGSGAFVNLVKDRTRIPVLGHAEGVCHVYVDRRADPAMAVAIVVNSKVQYPAACNAVETVLIHEAAAGSILPPLLRQLGRHGVEVRCCERTIAVARAHGLDQLVVAATEQDWRIEYGELVIACKIVESVEAAVDHIHTFGSGHTDAIVTDGRAAAAYFLAHVNSAGVFHNASTRFADGYRYGLGAEVGISTGKLHARGPVGLAGLTTYKWVLQGAGHLVE